MHKISDHNNKVDKNYSNPLNLRGYLINNDISNIIYRAIL